MMLSDLAKHLGVTCAFDEVIFSGVKTDSRAVVPGDFFVALQGPQYDGHDFLSQAKAKGAVAVLVSKPIQIDLPFLMVEHTLPAFGRVGHFFRSQVKCPVIALTGTCGKTTVRTMLAHILSQFGPTLSNAENHNNQIGVPQTLVRLNAEHCFAVVECGTDHHGEIPALSAIVEPDVALITNVDAGHLDGLGSIEQVLKEKSALLGGLKHQGFAILNADQPYLNDMKKHLLGDQKVITFGVSHEAEVRATDVRLGKWGCAHFMLSLRGRPEGEIQLTLPGEHQIANALAAVAVCVSLGLALDKVRKALSSVPQVPGRLVMRKGLHGSLVLDDAYNAGPRSFEAALKVLAASPGKHMLVMGEMRELAEEGERYHRKVGEMALSLGVDRLLAYGDLCRHTVSAFGQGAEYFETRESMLSSLTAMVQEGWTLLIKGSFSTKMSEIVEAILAKDEI